MNVAVLYKGLPPPPRPRRSLFFTYTPLCRGSLAHRLGGAGADAPKGGGGGVLGGDLGSVPVFPRSVTSLV